MNFSALQLFPLSTRSKIRSNKEIVVHSVKMSDNPILDDLGEDDDSNPLLSSMAGLMGGGGPRGGATAGVVPNKKVPAHPVKADVKKVSASTSIAAHPPLGDRPKQPSRGHIGMEQMNSSMSSLSSRAASEASVDLLGAFTTLKKVTGFSESTVGAKRIEEMSRDELVKFAKHMYSMVETYSMKAEEFLGDEDEEAYASLASASMQLGGSHEEHSDTNSGNGVSRKQSSGLVFKRRALHEQRANSAGSGESQMSIMRPPVVEKSQLKKSKDDDGYKTINEYTIVAELGRGAYGKVKLAINDITGESVAIKIMKKSLLKNGINESVVAREIAIMKKLRHRNVVSLFEVINDPEADKMYLVMQYVENGTFYTLNKKDMTTTPLPHEKVLKILRQLVSGLRYLHKRNIVHRDIKPDNILIGGDGTAYLSDFGVSEFAKTGSIHSMEGTPVFLSPELFRGDAHIDGVAADIWALGVTIYAALYGKPPFIGKSYEAVGKAVQNNPVHFPPDNPITSKWKDVLSRLLEKDPRVRMTLKDLKNHPIFDELEPGKAKDRTNHLVEVTDLEVLESIRNIPRFEPKQMDAFHLKPKAREILHNFTERIRKTVAAKAVVKPRIGGSGISAIRGISPRSSSRPAPQQVQTARVHSSTVPTTSALPKVSASDHSPSPTHKSVLASTPRLPSLRRTVSTKKK